MLSQTDPADVECQTTAHRQREETWLTANDDLCCMRYLQRMRHTAAGRVMWDGFFPDAQAYIEMYVRTQTVARQALSQHLPRVRIVTATSAKIM